MAVCFLALAPISLVCSGRVRRWRLLSRQSRVCVFWWHCSWHKAEPSRYGDVVLCVVLVGGRSGRVVVAAPVASIRITPRARVTLSPRFRRPAL